MDEIYNKYSKLVYNYLYFLTDNKELAEDLMQDTFYSAIKNIGKFNYKCKISVWLCQIAKNKYKNTLRNEKKKVFIQCSNEMLEAIIDENLENDDVENDIIRKEEKEKVYAALENLEEPIRELFYLRIKSNLPFKKIANILGKTEEWTRVNFYRTKLEIKEKLNNE